MRVRLSPGTLDDPAADTDIFRQAAARGRFLLPVCSACDRPHWYPRPQCPFCRQEGTIVWGEASGHATVYSYSVTRKANSPCVIAYVRLAEGPIILTNLVDCAPEQVQMDMPVTVKFGSDKNGSPLPVFAPYLQASVESQ